jgi:hypothetical protein
VTLASKLHPDRFSAMSGKVAAIVGYILGESWTEPQIGALSVTSDCFVLAATEFFGEAADLDRNLLNLLVAAEATTDERTEFERRYRERVDDWPVLSGPSPLTDRLTRRGSNWSRTRSSRCPRGLSGPSRSGARSIQSAQRD